MAQVTRSFACSAFRDRFVPTLHTQNKMGYLNVRLHMIPAAGWVAVLVHSLVNEAVQTRVCLAVVLDSGVEEAFCKKRLGLVQRDAHDCRYVVYTALPGSFLIRHSVHQQHK